MDVIGLGLKAFKNRAKLMRARALVEPAWQALRPSLPELVPLLKDLIREFAPDMATDMAAKGMRYDVEWIQKSLKQLGYRIDVDGEYGDATRDVVKMFQRKHSLTVDGWAGPETLTELASAIEGND